MRHQVYHRSTSTLAFINCQQDPPRVIRGIQASPFNDCSPSVLVVAPAAKEELKRALYRAFKEQRTCASVVSLNAGLWGQTNYVGGISTVLHGTAEGNLTRVTFSEGELITSISGFAGNVLYQVVLTTSLGKSYTMGSKNAGAPFNLKGPVYGFYGANAFFGGGYTLVALGYWTDIAYLPPPPLPQVIPLPITWTVEQAYSILSRTLQLPFRCPTLFH